MKKKLVGKRISKIKKINDNYVLIKNEVWWNLRSSMRKLKPKTQK